MRKEKKLARLKKLVSPDQMQTALRGLADALKAATWWLTTYSGGGAMGCYDQARAALEAAKPFLKGD